MQKKKVLILGATGMLGHMVYKYLNKLGTYELYNSVYRTPLNEESIVCNVKDQNAVKALFEQTKPNVVINCVGALVQESKTNPSSAIYLNALFPHILKDLCNRYHAKLIHVSTDCVFSGKRGGYSEDDFRDADDVYGRSKALGEIFDEPHCTLRTSIIGPELKEGTGLFQWFFNEKKQINGFSNVFWSGVTTLEFSRILDESIKLNYTGLFHVTNNEKISKFDLLNLINEVFNLNKTILKDLKYKSDKSFIQSKQVFNINSYEKMIFDLYNDMNENKTLYKNYNL